MWQETSFANKFVGMYIIYEHNVYKLIKNASNSQHTVCPKKIKTHKVNILYYNVYTSFWDILYMYPPP
jgi:hypothetical protein